MPSLQQLLQVVHPDARWVPGQGIEKAGVLVVKHPGSEHEAWFAFSQRKEYELSPEAFDRAWEALKR